MSQEQDIILYAQVNKMIIDYNLGAVFQENITEDVHGKNV